MGSATYLTHKGHLPPDKKRVYYSGTDQLEEGYPLAYKHTATLGGTTADDTFGVTVVKPNADNLTLFAGVVLERKKGPCWLNVTDGAASCTMVKAFVDGTTDVAQGDGLELVADAYNFVIAADATPAINVQICAQALEAHADDEVAQKLIRVRK